jgi:hypothetical protein
MADYFDKNMKVMGESALYLYSNISEHNIEENSDEMSISSCEAKNGELIAFIHGNDYDVRLNSLYNPTNEARLWAKQYEGNASDYTQRIIVCFGFGNGYFIRELLKVITEGENIVVYEPNVNMFMHTIKNYDITDILANKNIFVAVEEINQEDLEGTLRIFGYSIMYGQVTMLSLPDYEELYQEKLIWMMGVYQKVYLSAYMSGNTALVNGTKWADAALDNFTCIMKNTFIEQYEGILEGKIPVIIVASGPSLNKNMHILKEAKGKAFILAVDSAVKYLDKAGVEPDYIVTLDVGKLLSHFQNRTAMSTPMFASVESNPLVIKQNRAKKIFFDDDVNFRRWKNVDKEKMSINGAGSVALATFEIAKYLGAKTIILIGQDLAFEGNASHAMGERRQEDYSTVYPELIEGNNGQLLKTRYDWFTYLCWYNEQVRAFDGTVVNATEGGAKIDNTEILTLREAIERYGAHQNDVEKVMEKIENIALQENSEDIILQGLINLKEEFLEVSQYIDEALRLITILIKENSRNVRESNMMIRSSKRLSEINQIISEKSINILLERYTYSTTIKEYKDLFVRFKDQQKNREHVYLKSKKVYQGMKEGVETMMKKVEKLLDNAKEGSN